MTDQFAPADGVKSRKAHCMDLIRSLEPDTQIPVTEVMDLCDCDKDAAYSAMRDAAEALEGLGEQSVETQAPYGWVVLGQGEAMLKKQRRRKRKMVSQASKTAGTASAVKRELLTEFQKQEYDSELMGLAKVAEIAGRKTRNLAEVARQAKKIERPDPRIRQLPTRRREGA